MPLPPMRSILFRSLDEASLELTKREEPKIGGSFGGFIALVVCLCLIILVTCIGIWYLLRYHEPNDAERAARRTKKYQEQGGYNSEFQYPGSGRQSQPISAKLRSMFGLGGRPKKSRSKGVKLGSGGWVQASSGDEWDSDSDNEGSGRPRRSSRAHRPKELNELSAPHTGPYSPPLDTPFRPPIMPSDSASTVQFDMNHRNDSTVNPSRPFDVRYARDHDMSPSPQPSLSHSAMNSTVSVPRFSSPPSPSSMAAPRVRTTSPEPMSARKGSHPGTPSDGGPLSASSTRTFSGGTKFIEGL